MSRAIVSEITGFSTHDGPGIRTSVFVKGCPLRCAWCSNPETWTKERMVSFHAARCVGCGTCGQVCPQSAISFDGAPETRIDRTKCTQSFSCVRACLHSAYSVSGEEYTAERLFARIQRDKPFFGKAGGLTLSGGEPLSSPDFTLELFSLCKADGISTVLDTTGYGDPDNLREILAVTDLVLLDLKHLDPIEHERWTGVSNELILENAALIAQTVPTRVSFPLVPGANDSAENVEATAQFCSSHGIEWVGVNPLHTLGAVKYRNLGMPSPYEDLRIPSNDEVKRVRAIFDGHGIKTTVGRMM